MLYIVTGSTNQTLRVTVLPILKNLGNPSTKFLDIESELPTLPVGSVCLGMGGKFHDLLKSEGGIHKGKTLGASRQQVYTLKGVQYLLTYDPFIARNNPSLEVGFNWDIKLAVRLVNTGTLSPKLDTYHYNESFLDHINTIEEQYDRTGKAVVVCCDTETIGLNCYNNNAWLESIQIAYRGRRGVILEGCLRFNSLDNQPSKTGNPQQQSWHTEIEWLLNSDKVKIVGANFKYDMRWMLEKWDIECTNFVFDTTIVGSLLNENISNSLENHAKMFTDMGGYDATMNSTYDKSRMDLIPNDDFLVYSVGDVVACLQVYEALKSELLQDPLLTRFYVELLHRSSIAFLALEHEGVLVDAQIQKDLESTLTTTIAELKESMLSLIPIKIKLKHADNLTLRPVVLLDYFFGARGLNLEPKLFTAKTGKPSTALEHFLQFSDNLDAAEFVGLLKQNGSATKTLSTYIVGFNKHLQYDNRIHSTYMLHKGDFNGSSDSGTDTGRCVVSGTMILTNKGDVEITNLISRYNAGESFDIWTHKARWRSMIGTHNNGVKPVVMVQSQSHHLECTYNHPIMSFPSWRMPSDFKVSDWIYTHKGNNKDSSEDYTGLSPAWRIHSHTLKAFTPERVVAITTRDSSETYDITVAEDHSYIANGIVVHNTSAKDAAMQTLPKHTTWAKPLRKAYIAPKGMKILSCDYAAGELRVAAVIANELNMINAFNAGVDIHSATAAGLLQIPLEEFMEWKDSDPDKFKTNRQGAKAANFGILYGMSANGYRAYAATSYGRILTVEQAEEERHRFLYETYPALPKWHEDTKAFAHRHGFVRSPLGRIRHLPLINSREGEVRSKAERNAVNSCVQGVLSDLTQYSLTLLKDKYGFKELRPIMMVHDDLKFYVPENDAELWAARVCEVMSTLPLQEIFGWDVPITFSADAEIGYNLAEMLEL